MRVGILKTHQGGLTKRLQQGVAAVEMGLMTMFLVTTAGVATEFGRAISQYDTLAKSARSAARYLATHNSTDVIQQALYRNQAQNIALCGVLTCGVGVPPVVPNLTATHILVSTPDNSAALANISTGGFGTLDIVTVTISPGSNFPFTSLMLGIIPSFNFGPISVTMPTVL